MEWAKWLIGRKELGAGQHQLQATRGGGEERGCMKGGKGNERQTRKAHPPQHSTVEQPQPLQPGSSTSLSNHLHKTD